MRVRPRIGHGIDGKCDVESQLIRLSRSGFDAGSGCDTCNDNLRNPFGLQLRLEVRAGECAPCPLGYDNIAGLAIQFLNQIAESVGERREATRLLRAARCASGDIDQNDGEITPAKSLK